MAVSVFKILGFFVGFFLIVGLVSSAKFDELFQPSWALDHFAYEGELLRLKLDNYSGAGFQSKSKYMFGKVTVQIKLVEGDSAGTVTAFYMSSEEQRLNLWFDPTKDFHSYSLLWNQRQVVFLVDETPIRLHTNMENKGIPFPKDQAMGVYSSIWNADDWATQGGRVKTEWSHAPFVASYKGFEIDACECPVSVAAADNAKKCSSSGEKRFWWDEPASSELNTHQSHQLLWVKANHMVYDYCSDAARFPATPPECLHHSHRH
ncbi:hypothetical protein OIU77_006694 [Salix suchowensis]|uniref:Xyloglucan endotransglucosylase/hydrolase n=1 Tax=Salix suchowensis TaxID=1278906 RepID=A0ABQ9ANM4_9ROSI|nr:hypothetical protein OIU77_006694 [Salix suchowensis]